MVVTLPGILAGRIKKFKQFENVCSRWSSVVLLGLVSRANNRGKILAPFVLFYFIYFIPLPFSARPFLRGLLPCVRTNDLAYVCDSSEGAQTVRDLGPIYSNLRDPFATV